MITTHPTGELSAAVWIDLQQPDAEELERVQKATGLRIPPESEISEIEASSRLNFEGGAFYLSAPLAAPGASGNLIPVPVGFVLSPRVLITIHFAPLPAFNDANAMCKAQGASSADEALVHIFEVVVDRAADTLEGAASLLDELSRGAFREPQKKRLNNELRSSLGRVGAVADRISRIRDVLLGIDRVAAYVTQSGFTGAPRPNEQRLGSIRHDVASLTEYESYLSGKVQFLLDATLGFINIEQNDIVKTLTIASVVGIPPTLLAGIWGMNFHLMPELNWTWGYPLAWAAIIVSALLPLVWFKRRGWL